MQVILLERIETLGQMGDVVKVKPGYARNFLLPQKKALRANDANRQVFEANRERLEAENAERRSEAEKAGGKIDGVEIVLIRASSNAGHLYGSVNVRDIAVALVEKGHDVDKRQVVMGSPIKTIGMHEVTIALHPEVRVTIKANVARSDDVTAPAGLYNPYYEDPWENFRRPVSNPYGKGSSVIHMLRQSVAVRRRPRLRPPREVTREPGAGLPGHFHVVGPLIVRYRCPRRRIDGRGAVGESRGGGESEAGGEQRGAERHGVSPSSSSCRSSQTCFLSAGWPRSVRRCPHRFGNTTTRVRVQRSCQASRSRCWPWVRRASVLWTFPIPPQSPIEAPLP